MNDQCKTCGAPVRIMCFKGEGACGQKHREQQRQQAEARQTQADPAS